MMVASDQKTLVSNVWFSCCLFWRRKIFQWRTNATFVQLVQVWLLPHSGPPCCNGLILPHEAGWRKAPAATVNENTRSREVGFVFFPHGPQCPAMGPLNTQTESRHTVLWHKWEIPISSKVFKQYFIFCTQPVNFSAFIAGYCWIETVVVNR